MKENTDAAVDWCLLLCAKISRVPCGSDDAQLFGFVATGAMVLYGSGLLLLTARYVCLKNAFVKLWRFFL